SLDGALGCYNRITTQARAQAPHSLSDVCHPCLQVIPSPRRSVAPHPRAPHRIPPDSRFALTFPRPTMRLTVAPRKGILHIGSTLENKRILVVDDDQDILTTIQ